MPYFFARREGTRAVVEGDDARHLARSLRARKGQSIEVVDPGGFLLTVVLDSISPLRVEGEIVALVPHDPEPRTSVTIAIASLPAAALDIALSRCTELGAVAFVVFQAERSVARPGRPERWAAICREAAMLAGRLRIPAVHSAPSLEAAADAATDPLMLVRQASRRMSPPKPPTELTLFVGPEGGWTERELAAVELKASLGPRNLRSETAAVAGLAIALAAPVT